MMEQIKVLKQDVSAILQRLENTSDATLPAASILEDSQSTIRAPSHRGVNALSVESVVSNEIEIDQIRRWSFEGDLLRTRVYRGTEANDTDASFKTSIGRAHAWSIFSGLSLADISELSVIALPLFYEDLTNGISFRDLEPRAHHLTDPDLQATQEASTTHNSEGIMPQALSRKLSSGRTPQLGNSATRGPRSTMMDYRRTSLAGNRQQKASFNSRIYASFAGVTGTRNTNRILAESTTMWWDEERIEATVTRQFVLSKLRPDETERLNDPLGFGDGLTDDTYWEWIESKAKRMFLILVDLGVPGRIFDVIDDSWDDDNLPVPLDEVHRLQLTYDKDEKLERKFFHRQFSYLLRTIQKGDGLYYDEQEVVPLELAERKAIGQVAGLTRSNVDQVHLPGRPDDIFIRRRIPLGIVPGRMPQEEFLSGVEAMRAVDHDHLISLWASYIHQDCGYLLLTPVNDSTLKYFLTVTPQSVKILAELDRRILLLNWLHCLANALSFLHGQGLSHRNIKPTTVILDQDNHIFLGDSGIFSTKTFAGEKRGFDKEAYDYAAPEAPRPPTQAPVLLPVSRPSAVRRGNSIISSFPIPTSASTDSISTSTSNSKRNSLSKDNPQKFDIFSLGTIFLEILTFLIKRTSRNFASHRSAKNRTPGQGGGPPDSSFHKNLGQVESWMTMLAKDASKKEEKIFRGVSHILALVERMMAADPDERPNARYVQGRLRTIFTEFCGLGNQGTTPAGEIIPSRDRIHCGAHRTDENEWVGFEELRIASQQALAEACASVNPSATLGLNSGVVYGIERTSMASQSMSSGYSGSSGIGGVTMGRSRSQEGDGMSVMTKSSKSSEGKSESGSGSLGGSVGQGKPKPKAKAWQAPVYAGMLPLSNISLSLFGGLSWRYVADIWRVELSFG
jgi:serine/threonine protein kinase